MFQKCFVPMCLSTKTNNPDKIFYTVPKDAQRRNLWFKAACREYSAYANIYCGSDHFNLREDMENYTRYSLMGEPTNLKKYVVPHIFDCQPGRKTAHSVKPSAAAEKLRRKRMIDEILQEDKENSAVKFQKRSPSKSKQNPFKEHNCMEYVNSFDNPELVESIHQSEQTNVDANSVTQVASTQKSSVEHEKRSESLNHLLSSSTLCSENYVFNPVKFIKKKRLVTREMDSSEGSNKKNINLVKSKITCISIVSNNILKRKAESVLSDQTILNTKNIRLVRPPSVSCGDKLSKDDVMLTKRIASLRIHVERVIRRFREFALLQPHATIDHYIIYYMNAVMYIVTGLVNLQDPVIRI